ncbi:MAG: hypothetical protein EOP00_26015 [Pedobacter sp.]|nr:MAG: hypothetical protein EOP00_26015 [Pedobacter sp.]
MQKLTRAEMKKIMAGSGDGGGDRDASVKACENKSEGSSCAYSTYTGGICVKGTWTSLYCNIPGY